MHLYAVIKNELRAVNNPFLVTGEEKVIIESPQPECQFCFTPSLVVAGNGDIVVSHDLGGNIEFLCDYKAFPDSTQKMLCRIYKKCQYDNNFSYVRTFAMCHARLFSVGERLYIIGHNGYLQIAFSDDHGDTWSELIQLSETAGWHGSAGNVLKTETCLYLCMERRSDPTISGWNVAGLSPHVLSISLQDDLIQLRHWKISHSFTCSDIFTDPRFPYFGVPFRNCGFRSPSLLHLNDKRVIRNSPMGWLEGNIIQILDPDHIWFDPNGKTFYLYLRAHTSGVGYASLLKFVEDENFELFTDFVRVPSGEKMLFIPFPGGHNKFFILYDKVSQLYWCASTQAADSMKKVDCLSEELFGLPNNERHRLVLHFSRNGVDWLFAGVIAKGKFPSHARNYPAMVIHGHDLLIATRAGDERALNNQYTNLIMLHRITNFRRLIYQDKNK